MTKRTQAGINPGLDIERAWELVKPPENLWAEDVNSVTESEIAIATSDNPHEAAAAEATLIQKGKYTPGTSGGQKYSDFKNS